MPTGRLKNQPLTADLSLYPLVFSVPSHGTLAKHPHLLKAQSRHRGAVRPLRPRCAIFARWRSSRKSRWQCFTRSSVALSEERSKGKQIANETSIYATKPGQSFDAIVNLSNFYLVFKAFQKVATLGLPLGKGAVICAVEQTTPLTDNVTLIPVGSL